LSPDFAGLDSVLVGAAGLLSLLDSLLLSLAVDDEVSGLSAEAAFL
jgi:hypothetical protein